MAEREVVDPAALEKLQKMGGNGFVRQMISLFVEFGGRKVQEARAALDECNLQVVGKCVHAIKSSSMNLGARQVFEIASQMEQLTNDGSLDGLPRLQARLESEFGRAKRSLEKTAKKLQA